jgi:uncharacterized membrane protein
MKDITIKTIKSLSFEVFNAAVFAAAFAGIRYHWTHNFLVSFFGFMIGWLLYDMIKYFWKGKRNVK